MRRFPPLLGAVAAGELHLTGLLMLGPHLTDDNLASVMARAKHRTKKELARLVRQLAPLPDVPPRIEPLGPAPARLVPEAPTWSELVASLSPIRELSRGERPRDWMASAPESVSALDSCVGAQQAAPLTPEPPEQPAPARLVEEPQRFKVQFTASEEHVSLVEEAQALLSHSAPRVSLDELHLRAMRALVAQLKKQKYAVTARAQQTRAHEERSSSHPHPHPRQRGRYVPAAVRRAVFQRDAGRCTFADASGRRCPETHGLELHHLIAFALSGQHTVENLTLRCRAHNALAAEHDFGRDFTEHRRRSDPHEPWASHARDP